MTIRLIISAILVILAGASNGIMDNVSTQYERFDAKYDIDNDQWWNWNISWKNKYAVNEDGSVDLTKERFLGSKTVFVMFTDAWHFFKALMIIFIAISSIILGSVDIEIKKRRTIKYMGIGVIWYLLFTITFEIIYLT